MANIMLDICLSDIPKELIRKAKNGKKYLSVVLAERQNPDNYGNDHYLKVFVPKDKRKEGDKPIYIGSGKSSKFDGQQGAATQPAAPAPDNTPSKLVDYAQQLDNGTAAPVDGDLPF